MEKVDYKKATIIHVYFYNFTINDNRFQLVILNINVYRSLLRKETLYNKKNRNKCFPLQYSFVKLYKIERH